MVPGTVDLPYVLPQGELTPETILRYFWSVFPADRRHWESQHSDWRLYYDLYGVRSISRDDRAALEETMRLPVEMPFGKGIIDTVVGLDMRDRKEVVFRGDGRGTVGDVLGDWLTRCVRRQMVRGNGSAYREEGDAFEDAVIVGIGACEVVLDDHSRPLLGIVRAVRPWEVFPDCEAHGVNFRDARHVTRHRRWPLDALRARFGSRARFASAAKVSALMHPSHSVEGRWESMDEPSWAAGTYEFQFFRYEPFLYLEIGGRGYHLPDRGFGEAKARLQVRGVQAPPKARWDVYNRKVYYRAHVAEWEGLTNLLDLEELPLPEFTLRTLTCFRRRDVPRRRTYCFGLGRVMYDAQRFVNLGFRVVVEILARGSKFGGLIETSALPRGGLEVFQKAASKPGAWIEVAEAGISGGRILLSNPVTYPQGFDRLIEVLVTVTGKLTGVTEFLQGTSSRERSEVFVSNLQSQMMVMLARVFDAKDDFSIAIGRVLAYFVVRRVEASWIDRILADVIEEGMTHERRGTPDGGEETVPMVGADGVPLTPSSWIKKIEDLEAFEVTADTSQASMTNKMATWALMTNTAWADKMMQLNPMLQRWILPLMVRNMPVPGSAPERAAQGIEELYQQQEQMQRVEGVVAALAAMPEEQRRQVIEQALRGGPGGESNQGG
jgi:hypothetical protein